MKPHAFGRFLSPGCRGRYLKTLARTWRVSVRTIAQRMDVTQVRVRQVFELERVPYGIACDYIEGITGNSRVFSPAVAERVRTAAPILR